MFCVTRTRLYGAFTAAVLAFGAASAASAVTLQVDRFDRTQSAAAQGALAAFQAGTDGSFGPGHKVKDLRSEGFEGYKAWDGKAGDANPQATSVGSFTSIGGRGTGATAVDGGTKLQVRNDNAWVWGRYNTSGVDGKWLDSNDTLGMNWDVRGPSKFNSLAFLLTDVADVGAKFSIKVGDTLFSNLIGATGKLANGSIHLVRILLPEAVDHLQVKLFNDRLNDGFGIDSATVANVAPVPVPPAAALLVTGLVAMAGLRRRRRTSAATAA